MSEFVLKYIIPPLFLLAMFGAVGLYALACCWLMDRFDRWRAQ